MKLIQVVLLICALTVLLFFIASAQFTDGEAASGVIGQPSFTSFSQNNVDSLGLNSPVAVAVNPLTGMVYVSDAK